MSAPPHAAPPHAGPAWTLPGWAIFLLTQVGWFACVLGAARGRFWIGPMVVALLLVFHLWQSRERWIEFELIVAMGVAGVAIDSMLMCWNLMNFRGAPAACLAPPWIAALWLHFGTSRHSLLAVLRDRLPLAALIGMIAGPVAYGAGVRFGAASFHPETWPSLIGLGVAWGMILPLATWFTWHREPQQEPSAKR